MAPANLRPPNTNPTPTDLRPAVFILGLSGRSGTHYFQNLLCLHPDCAAFPVSEDFLLNLSPTLAHYAKWVREGMLGSGPVHASVEKKLLHALGNGLLSLINAQAPGKTMVLKTPGPFGAENFFDLFPRSRLLFIVRDGRNCVESHRLRTRKSRDELARDWTTCAELVLRFDRRFRRHARNYRIVRYEDLFPLKRAKLAEVLRFLELDPDRYDFEAAEKLPVVGSYDFNEPGARWKPKKKDAAFRPNDRWKSWSPEALARFHRIAGKAMRQLGYR